ncbi:MAG: Uma2 family endonuclease [Planctomycetota bacterium]
MTALLEPKIMTQIAFLEMEHDGLFEFVNGEIVEKNMGAISMEIGNVILFILRTYCYEHKLGRVMMEQFFQCYSDDPERVRRPDVAFISKGKLPGDKLPEGAISVVPDLVVEVVSPYDKQYKVDEKVKEYLDAGVRIVWVVSPPGQYVRIYRNGRPTTELSIADTITGEDVIAGFSCKVSEFFATI